MIKNWKVNLLDNEAEHINGLKIKLLPDTYEEKGKWVASDSCDERTLNEGIACYDHQYSKVFLKKLLKKNNVTIDDIVEITNAYIDEKKYREDHLSSLKLNNYLSDKDVFSINTSSIIKAAIYFYKKKFNADK